MYFVSLLRNFYAHMGYIMQICSSFPAGKFLCLCLTPPTDFLFFFFCRIIGVDSAGQDKDANTCVICLNGNGNCSFNPLVPGMQNFENPPIFQELSSLQSWALAVFFKFFNFKNDIFCIFYLINLIGGRLFK